ncbi:MAG: lytic transglycosylase domain-containing protein [Hyphomicrobiales bacterium]|nr:MAG: lytic transglycosylase domain-containing protein [Hyphomicrobiales bacterium]
MIEGAAEANGLPPEFLARLIWKESLFDVKAVSPMGALGIAQFMPETAQRRGLADPFDPVQAIPASAAYLAELRTRFGNLGLAAAAYNSGEERVDNWLGGRAGLPGETLGYVHSITFRPAHWFREPGREVEPRPLDAARSFAEACQRLPVVRTRSVLFEGAEWQPWGVQVAGNIHQGAALRQFARLEAQYRRIIGGVSPIVMRARSGLGSKRIWSVRIGADSRLAADRICMRLRIAGGACVVRRN